MDGDEVAAVALGFVIPSEVLHGQVIAGSAALVTVKAPFLLVTLFALAVGPACQDSVATHPIGVVVGCDSLAFVAGIALLDFHLGVFFVCYLFSIRLRSNR